MTALDIEMRRRHMAVLQGAAERGADALLVTSPQHLVYLSGDETGYQQTAVPLGFCGQVMTVDESVLVVRRYDAASAVVEAGVSRIVEYFDEDDRPIEVLAKTLREMGLAEATVGVALSRWGLTITDREELARELPDLRLVDVSLMIDAQMECKSEVELGLINRAMRLTEVGVHAFASALRVGVTESELAAEVMAAMIREGSELPFYPASLLAGVRSALPHGGWSDNAVAADQPVFIELSGAWRHYHAPLVRTAIVGRDDEAECVYAVARAANEAGVAAIGPDVPAGAVDAAVRDSVKRAGYAEAFRGRSGYAMGIDWTLRGATSLRPGGRSILRDGMTLHVPTSLIVAGRFCVGCSQSVVVTADGASPLSDLPLDVIHV